jgi:hypothetical protein
MEESRSEAARERSSIVKHRPLEITMFVAHPPFWADMEYFL